MLVEIPLFRETVVQGHLPPQVPILPLVLLRLRRRLFHPLRRQHH